MLSRFVSWSRPQSITSASSSAVSSPSESSVSIREREPIHLPDEIILEILSYYPEGAESQTTLWACCLISRQWHNLAVSTLYAKPHLYGWNYDPFVRTICPSKNVHIRKSDLAGLVKTLDMSKLAYQGSKSITARLLGRTKGNLETFVAPRANWGINCLAALRKCTNLRCLDLGLVSEAMGYRELSDTIKLLRELREFRFPRSASKLDRLVYTKSHMDWPPLLEDLTLSGDLYDFIRNDVKPLDGRAPNLPTKVTRLTIQHSSLDRFGFEHTLIRMGQNLTYLQIAYLNSSHFLFPYPDGASAIFDLCPSLDTLVIGADLLTRDLLFMNEDSEDLQPIVRQHQLRHLYVLSPARAGLFSEDELMDTRTLAWALGMDALPALRKVTYEVYFKAPKDWSAAEAMLDTALKQRAEGGGEKVSTAGIKYAILQGT